MEFRLWIGFWTAIFLLLIVIFNLSFMVKYITRFTEDCFATLVAIIFIIDALKSTANLRKAGKSKVLTAFADAANSSLTNANDTSFKNVSSSQMEVNLALAKNDAVFFFSVLLFVFTFFVCMTLKSIRSKPFLPSKVYQIAVVLLKNKKKFFSNLFEFIKKNTKR
jgi:hypothetical protein